MDGKKLLCRLFLMAGLILFSRESRAAVIELSGMVAYSKSDFADGYKSTQRRYTGSIDFKFTPVSALQFEYTDSQTKISYPINLSSLLTNPVTTTQETMYRDKIYSFNWVQNLVPSKWVIQPYIVLGGGKMIRRLRREIPQLNYREDTSESITTGTGGAGLRIFLTKSMAVKGEAKTYVPKFQFSKYKENQLFSVGISWAF